MAHKVCTLTAVLAFVLLASFSSTQFTFAFDPAIENEANEIFSLVLSPFCPGRVLLDCPSRQASELKNEIREKLVTGVTREEILADLRAEYGDTISSVPSTEGFGLLAWLAPIVFLLGGFLFMLWWLVRKQKEESDEAS